MKLRKLIKSVANISGDYDEKYMKIKFSSDGDLPLNKKLKCLFFKKTQSITHKFPQMSVCIIINARYDRIGFSGEIDISKTNVSKKCDICHY